MMERLQGVFGKAVQASARVACALVIALQGLSVQALGASSALAAEQESGWVVEELKAYSDSSAAPVDLNREWSRQEGGTSEPFYISKGGTYALTGDFNVSMPLVVDASGEDVVIDFGSNTLKTVSDGGSGYAIYAKSAASVQIVGDSPTSAKLYYKSNPITYAIRSDGADLTVKGLTVQAVQNDYSFSLASLQATDVYAAGGAVVVDDCVLSADISNQTSGSGNKAAQGGVPANVYLGSSVSSASVTNVKGTVLGAPSVSVTKTGFDAAGWAFGVLSETASKLVVSGCSFDVSSPLGYACGICARNASIDSTAAAATSVKVDGAQYAIGVYAAGSSPIALDSTLNVSYSATGSSHEVGLFAAAANLFKINSAFSSDGLSVQVGSDLSSANSPQTRIATFDSAVDAAQRQSIAGQLNNALGADAPCSITASGVALLFTLVSGKAAVELEHDGAVREYASVATAVADAVSGDTVRLLRDVGDIQFAPSSSSTTRFTIDLNGHAIESFTTGASGTVVLTSSVAGGIVSGSSSSTNSAVAYSGEGALNLENVDVSNVSSTGKAYGVYSSGTGSISLANVNVTAASGSGEVRAVYLSKAKCGAFAASGGSISASALSMGTTVYGISSSATVNGSERNEIALNACPVTVKGTTGSTVGIDAKADLAIAGTAGVSSVSVSTSGQSSNVVGITMAYAGASASLNACTVEVKPGASASGVSYWCFTSGGKKASLALDSACTFDSASDTAIYVTGEKLMFGSDFALGGTGTTQVRVDGLSDDEFGLVDQAAPAAQALAARLTGATGTAYEGCTATATSSSGAFALSWSGVDVARNETTGTVYQSLSEAFADLADGQKLVLLRDCVANGALSSGASATIDLAGHDAVVNAASAAAAGSSATGGALAFSGAGTIRIIDSSASQAGSLDVRVGSTAESARTTYQGIAVSGGGTLEIEDCLVKVTYTGRSSLASLPVVTLRGISSKASNVKLSGMTRLEVASASSPGDFGASVVAGIYQNGETGDVTVGEDSSVSVENVSKAQGYTNQNTANLAAVDMDALKGIAVDEGVTLYDQLQERFYIKSKFDSKNDDAGYEYGTQVYYLSDTTLPCGMEFWAYSDPVSAAEAGKVASIVASHAFVDVDPEVSQVTYGITGAAGYAGSVVQSGSVRVSGDEGSAFALCLADSADVSSAEAKLAASCGGNVYPRYQGSFDLANFIEFEEKYDSAITYIGQNNPRIGSVQLVSPVALASAKLGESYETAVTNGGSVVDAAYPPDPDKVEISFTNLFDAQGDVAADKKVEVVYGATLRDSGVYAGSDSAIGFDELAPDDVSVDGVTYRFVGWRPVGLATTFDWAALYDLPFDDAVSGASSGTVTLGAVYVAVGSGQHMVSFRNQYTISAYAVDDGAHPSFRECMSGSADIPTHVTSESGYTFSFKGWGPGNLADDGWSSSAACYNAALPVMAGADVTYTALYAKTVSRTTLSFVYMRSGQSGYTYSADYEEYFDWTQAEKTAISVADKRVKVGDTFDVDGVEYRFDGWSPRASDVEPMYTDSIALSYGDSTFTSSILFYGIYTQSAKTATLRFHVDGALYATAADVPVTETLNAAFAASDNPKTPTKDDKTFRGWNTNAEATAYFYGNIKTVASIVGDGDSADLYAIWRDVSAATSATVSFYDDDHTTRLLRLVIDTDQTIFQAYGEAYAPPAKTGKVFLKWVDSDGNEFSTTETVVTADVDLYATYRTEGSSSGSLSSSDGGSKGASVSNPSKSSSAGSSSASSSSGSSTGSSQSNSLESSDSDESTDSSSGSGTSLSSSDTSSSLTTSTSGNSALISSGASSSTSGGSGTTTSGVARSSSLNGSGGASANASSGNGGDGDPGNEATEGSSDEEGEDAAGEGNASDSGFSVDGNAVGFVAFQVACIALLGALVWWLLARRRTGSDGALDAVSAPETEVIRF